MRSILVTRPQPVADEFAEKLRREGFRAYVAPLLEYVDTPAELGDLSPYQALVFGSAKAVQCFVMRSLERDLPVLAVGDATATAAEQAGFKRVYSAQGDNRDLINLMREKKQELALEQVLHPCSEDTPDDIVQLAGQIGVKLVRCVVYRADFIKRLPDDVSDALLRNQIDIVTLFSPRTAANFSGIMQRKELQGVSARLEVVCISERVAAELEEVRWRKVLVATRPTTEAMMEVLQNKEGSFVNRRQKPDRRQNKASRDRYGHVSAGSYAGPDRRSGSDRRAYHQRQQERILQEKVQFVNRSILTGALILMAVVLAAVFLMGPEYLHFKLDWARQAPVEQSEEEGANMEHRSLGGFINRQIEKIGNVAQVLTGSAREIAFPQGKTLTAEGVPGLVKMLARADTYRTTREGHAAVEKLQALLLQSGGNSEAASAALKEARNKDSSLNALLGDVGWKDLAAAGLLLTLSEFRSNVSNHRPYAQDLSLLRQYSGNDPEMNAALQRLSPYAERGIKGREALEKEFNGFAQDIMMSAVRGQDISVSEQAMKRYENFSRAVSADQITGSTPEAVTARARLLLRQGDVKGAVRELQSLEGAPAQAAEPWMDNAAGYVIAEQSSDDLTHGLLQAMGGGPSGGVDSLFAFLKQKLHGPEVIYLSPALRKQGNYDGVLAPASKMP